MEHLVEKMKTTVKRGLILRFEGIDIINIITFIVFTKGLCFICYSTFVLEMRNAVQTTPLTLSSTCTQRRARVCLTAERTSLDICSRYAAH